MGFCLLFILGKGNFLMVKGIKFGHSALSVIISPQNKNVLSDMLNHNCNFKSTSLSKFCKQFQVLSVWHYLSTTN